MRQPSSKVNLSTGLDGATMHEKQKDILRMRQPNQSETLHVTIAVMEDWEHGYGTPTCVGVPASSAEFARDPPSSSDPLSISSSGSTEDPAAVIFLPPWEDVFVG